MLENMYIRVFGRDGFIPSGRRLVSILGAAALLAFAGGLFAAGTGTLDRATGWYEAGSNVTVTATATNYSVFAEWIGNTNGTTITDTNSTLNFTVTGPSSITAVFDLQRTASNSVPYQWLADVLGITSNFESVVTLDPDGDTFTTAQEYWAGTDPTTNASYLHISQVEMTVTNFRLIWAHSNIGTYKPEIVIQLSESMNPVSWSNAVVMTVTNGVNSWGVQKDQKSTFFKLSVTNMP